MRINVRTTMNTYIELVAASKVAGLSVPRYLIESALRESSGGWSLRQQRWWADRLDTVETRLIRIGTNLNQMAAVTNTTGQPPDGLAAALTYLTSTLDRHRAVLDEIDPADRTRQPRS